MHLSTSHARSLSQGTGACGFQVELCEHTGAQRALAERFISDRFNRCFGAQVKAFMPRLFSVMNDAGDVCAAFGLRSASHRLFLEQYLDLPIEHEINVRSGMPVQRLAIVEAGQFAGAFPGAVRTMITLLTEHLHREGSSWVVFTGTAPLRNAFTRLGLCPIDIRDADVARLSDRETGAWGSYYAHQPRVVAGNIGQGYEALQTRRHAAAAAGSHA
ncbi:thermostable hemolysin [soil metagenome]